jgi:hypothetical protein
MILATTSLSLCFEFIGRHPGLLLVLIGVAGEIIFDWKEMGHGRLAYGKRISAILLVIGLTMEFWEAAKSDKEIAAINLQATQAEKKADEAKEQAAKFDLARAEIEKELEQSQSNNLQLKIELDLAKQFAGDAQIASQQAKEIEAKMPKARRLTDDQKMQLLRVVDSFPKGEVSAFIPQDVPDAKNLINDLGSVFLFDGWKKGNVSGGIMAGLPDGITIRSASNNGTLLKAICDTLNSFGMTSYSFTNDSWGMFGSLSNSIGFTIGNQP